MAAGSGDRPPTGAPTAPLEKRLLPNAPQALGPFVFALFTVALGVVAGVGAYGFRALIGLVHNLAFLGRLSFAYDSNTHTPQSPWGLLVILVPAVGAIVVVLLVRFAPEARGHGVPEVMDAIYYKKSVINPLVAAIKSLASAVSIGTGGSVGREGPIIQIGAAFASWMGKLARVSRWQRATLVAAGGGAGIAATFNTPIGGVLFAVEVLMHEVSVRTLVPVALATGTATYVGHYLFGDIPAFVAPPPLPGSTGAIFLPAFVLLGAMTALVSVLFIRALYGTEDVFQKWIPGSDLLRHGVGMLGVGAISAALFRWQGHYYVQGVGYATIMDILSGSLDSVGILLILFALKLAATSLTLGSGASGGIFSPSLFLGATLGGAFGVVLHAAFPRLPVDPAALALAGMAGVVAGTTGAALTAIVMIFEMTLDYSVVLPMTLTVAVSYGLRRALLAESIYTAKLVRRGHYMPEALQANAHLVHHASDIALAQVAVLRADASPETLNLDAADAATHMVLTDAAGAVVGVLGRDWLLAHRASLATKKTLAEVARTDFVVVSPDETIFDLMAAMRRARALVVVVVGAGEAGERKILGLITRDLLADVLAEGMGLFGD